MPVVMAGMLLTNCQNERNLHPEAGLKAVKILNSDLVNLGSSIQENKAFTALNFLLSEPTSPLSFSVGLTGKWLYDTLSTMKSFAGNYSWTDSGFIQTGESDIIDISFFLPGPENKQATFKLNSFECEKVVSDLFFPLDVRGEMRSENISLLNIIIHSVVTDEMPEQVNFLLKGKDLTFSIHAKRTRQDNAGKLLMEIELKVPGYQIISGTINAVIGYSGRQAFFRTYEPDLRIFDVKIKGKLDYGKVDPTSQDYIKSFNDHCHIGFYENGSGKKIGDFGIGPIENGEKLGWMVYLSDKTPILLEEQIIMVKRLLEYKLPNIVRH